MGFQFFFRPQKSTFLKLFFPTCRPTNQKVTTMRIFSLAALAIGAYGQSVMLDENTPCSNFAEVFGSFDGMKTKCKGKSNKKKTKQFCNLICENGQENVWSTRPIKCKAKKHSDDVGQYKWKPNKIKNAGSLCDAKEKMSSPQDHVQCHQQTPTFRK